MNLKKLLDSVLALGSNISIKDGKEIYKKRLVSNLSSKKIDNIYHIYSKVKENNGKEYSCHIKYNLKSEKLIGVKCTCSTYEEFSKYKSNYICKHIIATIFYFYIIGKSKIKKNYKENQSLNKIKDSNTNKINNERKAINLDLDIKKNDNKTFDIQIKIGEKITYLIPKISEFLKCREIKGQFRINGEFLYNSSYMKFNDKDNELLDYIALNLKSTDSFNILDGKVLRVKEKYIEEI